MNQLPLFYIGWTETAFVVLFMVVWLIGATFVIYDLIRTKHKARAITAQWVEKQGCRLLEFNWRVFGTGPFRELLQARRTAYFRFYVIDNEGKKQAGWVKFNFLFGSWEPEFRWIDNSLGPRKIHQ